MRWLFRPISTLLLAPILFEIVRVYYAATAGSAVGLWPTTMKQLVEIYVAFTLPALLLVLVILLPVDLLLRRSGIGLLTIVVSPLVAALAVVLLRKVTGDAHVQAWMALSLAITYGIVWGLTIRDPSTVMAA